MAIVFQKLTPEAADAFFRFFDRDAFSDHEDWAGCYCLESHIASEANEALTDREARKQKAAELIGEGVMTGYLIYDGDEIVGWCNAGDKTSYGPICAYAPMRTGPLEKGRVKVLYCLDIAPQARGRGLARLALEQVLADAKEEGYAFVEAYPFRDTSFPYQYRGPVRLYEQYGFERLRELDWCVVMSKAL